MQVTPLTCFFFVSIIISLKCFYFLFHLLYVYFFCDFLFYFIVLFLLFFFGHLFLFLFNLSLLVFHCGLDSNVFSSSFSFSFHIFQTMARQANVGALHCGAAPARLLFDFAPYHVAQMIVRYYHITNLFTHFKDVLLTITWAASLSTSSSSSSSASSYGSLCVPVPCTFTPFLFYPFETALIPFPCS